MTWTVSEFPDPSAVYATVGNACQAAPGATQAWALPTTVAWLWLGRWPVLSGVLIGVVCAVKPMFLLWPLLLWLVWRLGYDRRAWLAQAALALAVLPLCFFFTDPDRNINWVFGPGEKPQDWMPPRMRHISILPPDRGRSPSAACRPAEADCKKSVLLCLAMRCEPGRFAVRRGQRPDAPRPLPPTRTG